MCGSRINAAMPGQNSSRRERSFIRHIFQNVSRLAVQGGADGLQGGEADGLGLVVFQNGQVRQGDVHLLRQLGEGHLPPGHHHVQIHYDHAATSNRQVVLRLDLRRLAEQGGHHQAQQAEHGEDGHEQCVVGHQRRRRAEPVQAEDQPGQCGQGDDKGADSFTKKSR